MNGLCFYALIKELLLTVCASFPANDGANIGIILFGVKNTLS